MPSVWRSSRTVCLPMRDGPMFDHRRPYLRDASADQQAVNGRRYGRVLCQDVKCTLGTVLDISAGGMRVRSRRKPPKPGTTLVVGLRALGGEIVVECTVKWTRARGLLFHESGLQFMESTPEMRRALVELARAAAYNETIVKRGAE